MEQVDHRRRRWASPRCCAGGVIMDVVNAEQARIAEDAGAAAVMALERVPAQIRKEGGVARASDPAMIRAIQEAVSIPVMAKCRIGHFMEARILEALEVDFIDESEVLTPADEEYHIDKHAFRVPFVCGCRDLGEALRRIGEGAALLRTKGEAGTGNIVEAVRHLRALRGADPAAARRSTPEELMTEAKQLGAPYELVRAGRRERAAAGAELRRRRHRHARRRGAVHGARRRGGVRRQRHLPQRGPGAARARHRRRDHVLAGRRRKLAAVSAGLGAAMRGLELAALPPRRRASRRGAGDGRAIGVLALQGGFARAPARALVGLGHGRARGARRRRGPRRALDGLVLPGGESTRAAAARSSATGSAGAARRASCAAARPVLATCAGLILAARRA